MTNAHIEEMFELYYSNPTWKRYYDLAPSDAYRRFIRLEWSLWDAGEAYAQTAKEMNEIRDREFTKEDWLYELKHCGHPQARYRLKEKIRARFPEVDL